MVIIYGDLTVKEKICNIWDQVDGWRCIPTNGFVKNDGKAVMGAGVAKQAVQRFEDVERMLARCIKENGNRVSILSAKKGLISFPTKNNWWENSDIDLIERSAYQLHDFSKMTILPIYLPRPGCANGGLKWEDVKPVIEPILGDRIIVVTNQP